MTMRMTMRTTMRTTMMKTITARTMNKRVVPKSADGQTTDDRRCIFDAFNSRKVTTLDDVDDAFEVVRSMDRLDDKKSYFYSLGIDFDRAVKYGNIVRSLEAAYGVPSLPEDSDVGWSWMRAKAIVYNTLITLSASMTVIMIVRARNQLAGRLCSSGGLAVRQVVIGCCFAVYVLLVSAS